MDLQARITLHQEEFENLEQLNEQFLANKEPQGAEIELFMLKRERSLLQLKLEPILTADKMRLKLLRNTAALNGGEQSEADQKLTQSYQEMLETHQRVIRQEQAIAMHLRGLQQKMEAQNGGKNVKKRITTYTQQLQADINVEAGSRFDRKR